MYLFDLVPQMGVEPTKTYVLSVVAVPFALVTGALIFYYNFLGCQLKDWVVGGLNSVPFRYERTALTC